MEYWPISLIGTVAIGVIFFIVKMITGFIIRIVVLVLLAAFLFYLYKSGAHHMILAPGSPDSPITGPVILSILR